jgi:hypothetical protein
MIGSAPNKNITNQIKALIGMKVYLTIIGIIPNDTIKLLKNNNINYHNYYNLTDQEIINEFKKSDILLFASTYEGFGLPIISLRKLKPPSSLCSLLVFIVFGYFVASLWLLLMSSQDNSNQLDSIQRLHAFFEWLSTGFGWLVSKLFFCASSSTMITLSGAYV